MKKILVLLCLAFSVNGLKAQNNITIVTNEPAYWFPASVTMNDSVFFAVKIVNLSLVTFNDALTIQVAVDTGTVVPNFVIVASEVYPTDSIAGLDTVVRAVNYVEIDPTIFQEGNNTVVIWPMCPNQGTPPDTMYNETFAYLGINEQPRFEYPAPYPNPTQGHITFKRLINPIEEVRIYNTQGTLVATHKKVTTLNISKYEPGVYYLQYMHKDRLIVTRIIKS